MASPEQLASALAGITITADFKLGPALLHTADRTVPSGWRTDLLRRLDGRSRARFSVTCTAALQYLLEDWPEARLRTNVRGPSGRLVARFQAARKQLLSRGTAPTTVVLAGRGQAAADWWQAAFPALGSIHCPTTLVVQLQQIPAPLLSHASSAFQQLVSLTLGSPDQPSTAQLPPPANLPALRIVTVYGIALDSAESFFTSLSLYLPQLEQLSIARQPRTQWESILAPGVWERAFSLSTRSDTLRRIQLPASLSPRVYRQLQQCAPNLEDVTVENLGSSYSDRAPVTTCEWKALRIAADAPPHFRRYLSAGNLGWLPLPADGRLVLDVSGVGEIELSLPLPDKAAEKLAAVELQGCREVFVMDGAYEVEDDTWPLLRDILPLLATLQSPHRDLSLHRFTIGPALADALPALAAEWGELTIRFCSWSEDASAITTPLPTLTCYITDTLDHDELARLLQHATCIDTLTADEVELNAPVSLPAVLPWRVVEFWRTVDVAHWVAQDEHLGGRCTWKLVGLDIALTGAEIGSGEAKRLAERVSAVKLADVGTVTVSPAKGCSPADQPRVLRACLRIARRVPHVADDIVLNGWVSTPALVAQLRGLPIDETELTLCLKSAPAPPSPHTPWPLAQAAALIPPNYTTWVIDQREGLTHEECEALIFAVPSQRRLTVKVLSEDKEWVQSVCERVEERADRYAHLIVRCG